MFVFSKKLEGYREEIENFMRGYLESLDIGDDLKETISYAVFSGGKRFRPAIILHIGASLQVPRNKLLWPAAGVEFIHSYSLVHDDLPALDNDAERRGKPTLHVKFGEDMAVLAGDALALLAPQIVLESHFLTEKEKVRIALELTRRGGAEGIVEGQIADIRPKERTKEWVEYVFSKKTAPLFEFCMWVCGYLAGKFEAELLRFGKLLGLAFQARDDLLDAAEGKVDTTGISVVDVLGKDETERLINNWDKEANKIAERIEKAGMERLSRDLMEVFNFAVHRNV